MITVEIGFIGITPLRDRLSNQIRAVPEKQTKRKR